MRALPPVGKSKEEEEGRKRKDCSVVAVFHRDFHA